MRNLEEEISSANGSASSVATDVTDPVSVDDAFQLLRKIRQPLRAVINCAGTVDPVGPLAELDPGEIARSINTNVTGTLFVTRASIRALKSVNSPSGTILNVSSGAARRAYSGWSCYCSGKAAVDMATACAARECDVSKVRIFAVSPGPFESRMQETLRATDPSDFPAHPKFVKLHEDNALPPPEEPGRILIDMVLSDWPELHGTVMDLRDPEFQRECERRGIRTL